MATYEIQSILAAVAAFVVSISAISVLNQLSSNSVVHFKAVSSTKSLAATRVRQITAPANPSPMLNIRTRDAPAPSPSGRQNSLPLASSNPNLDELRPRQFLSLSAGLGAAVALLWIAARRLALRPPPPLMPMATVSAVMPPKAIGVKASRDRTAATALDLTESMRRHPTGKDPVTSLMTHMPLLTVHPATPVDEALQLMVTHSLGGLPVVDDDNRLLGVVSDADLVALEAFVNTERSLDIFPRAGEDFHTFTQMKALAAKQSKRSVGEILAPDCITISPSTTIKKTYKILIKNNVLRVPVVDDSGRLLGIVSRGHIIRMALSAAEGPVEMAVPQPSLPDLSSLRPEDPVSKVMKRRLVNVTPDTPITTALREMIRRRIRGLVVVDDNGLLVGVASDYDLLMVDAMDNFKDRHGDAFPKPAETMPEFKRMKASLSKQSAATVGQIMTANPYFVTETTSFSAALHMFADKNVARLPVVDTSGRCVGVLTRARVMAALMSMRQAPAP